MIAGLEEATEGSIYIGDRLVNDVPPKDRDIAMVFQNYALYPHMTAYENMAFGLKLRKFSKAEIDDRVREAASILGIESLLQRKPKALSGGQRQRVAVGRAIVRKPRVFLFDEPLSNLDAKLRVQMRTEISKLHQKLGATMVYVTHDQTEAMTMGDTIVLMRDGHVQQIDSPLGIYNSPKNRFVAGFIGSPAMNFFKGTIERSGKLHFREETSGTRIPVPKQRDRSLRRQSGKQVVLGIRPEHLGIARGKARRGAIKARVEVVEPMGNEVFVYFTTSQSGEQHVARLATSEEPEVGKSISLSVDMTKLHFFDMQTEESLSK
jgi:multiple sugar transport system ATP-binding protein